MTFYAVLHSTKHKCSKTYVPLQKKDFAASLVVLTQSDLALEWLDWHQKLHLQCNNAGVVTDNVRSECWSGYRTACTVPYRTVPYQTRLIQELLVQSNVTWRLLNQQSKSQMNTLFNSAEDALQLSAAWLTHRAAFMSLLAKYVPLSWAWVIVTYCGNCELIWLSQSNPTNLHFLLAVSKF